MAPVTTDSTSTRTTTTDPPAAGFPPEPPDDPGAPPPPTGTLDPQALKQALAGLLAAGFTISPTGEIVIKDSTGVAATDAAAAAALATFAGELHLAPPGPPKVTLDGPTCQGAESFAANLDLAMDDFLSRALAAAAAGKDPSGAPNASGTGGPGGTTGTTGTNAPGQPAGLNIQGLTAGQLLAAFLKLQITDPNNSVEVHNQLQDLMSKLRQDSIEGAKREQAAAAELAKKAEAYAETAGIIGTIVMVVVIIVAIVATIFTLGAAAPAIFAGAAVVASLTAAATAHATALVICALIAAAAMVVSASANKVASDKAIAAEEKGVDVKIMQRFAEVFQKMLEDEGAIVKLIMEAKNNACEATVKMMNAMAQTMSKLMSAQMAR